MKIEICEQMVQSWLQHYKQCEIVQTNWKVSPLRLRAITDSDIDDLEKFMNDFQDQLNCDLEDETKGALQEAVNEELRTDEKLSGYKRKKQAKLKTLTFSRSQQQNSSSVNVRLMSWDANLMMALLKAYIL